MNRFKIACAVVIGALLMVATPLQAQDSEVLDALDQYDQEFNFEDDFLFGSIRLPSLDFINSMMRAIRDRRLIPNHEDFIEELIESVEEMPYNGSY